MGNNVSLNHTLKEYNKKYKIRKDSLLKLTKKEVEDFDKKYGHYSYNGITHKLEGDNYLLKDRKWWFTKEDDSYHEIPKAPRFVWFRNLNGAVQVAACVLAAGAVGSAVAVPIVMLNQAAEPDVSIDDADKVTWSNKHYDSEGNACLTIKGKDGNQIESVELNIDNYKCKEGTDFTYNASTGELIVKKSCIDLHKGKINIKPIFAEEIKTFNIDWNKK